MVAERAAPRSDRTTVDPAPAVKAGAGMLWHVTPRSVSRCGS
jgi:hypothetical protein